MGKKDLVFQVKQKPYLVYLRNRSALAVNC